MNQLTIISHQYYFLRKFSLQKFQTRLDLALDAKKYKGIFSLHRSKCKFMGFDQVKCIRKMPNNYQKLRSFVIVNSSKWLWVVGIRHSLLWAKHQLLIHPFHSYSLFLGYWQTVFELMDCQVRKSLTPKVLSCKNYHTRKSLRNRTRMVVIDHLYLFGLVKIQITLYNHRTYYQ